MDRLSEWCVVWVDRLDDAAAVHSHRKAFHFPWAAAVSQLAMGSRRLVPPCLPQVSNRKPRLTQPRTHHHDRQQEQEQAAASGALVVGVRGHPAAAASSLAALLPSPWMPRAAAKPATGSLRRPLLCLWMVVVGLCTASTAAAVRATAAFAATRRTAPAAATAFGGESVDWEARRRRRRDQTQH